MSEQINTAEDTKKKKVSSMQKSADNADFCVYLGPDITGVIQRGTVYKGTKSAVVKKLEAAIAKYPLIETLIIPNTRLTRDRIRVNTPGNVLYENYNRILMGRK